MKDGYVTLTKRMVAEKRIFFKHQVIRFIMILLASQIFMILAYYNGYPLNMGDSGGYVLRGFTKESNHHWAQFYSIFVRITSLNWSLFGVVLVQNFLIAYLLFRIVELCIDSKRVLYVGFLAIVICLTFGSSLTFISNLLMPDILTTAGAMAMIVAFLKKKVDIEFILLCVVIGICQMSHKSSGPIFALGFLSYFSIVTLLLIVFEKSRITSTYFKKISIVLFSVFMATLIEEPINSLYFVNTNPKAIVVDSTRTSDSKYHFVFVKLYENKILDDFLEEYCPEKEYVYLCDSSNLAAILYNGIGDDLHGNDQALFLEVEDVGRTALLDMKYVAKIVKRSSFKRMSKFYGNRGSIPLLNSIFNEYQIPRLYQYLPDDVQRLVNCRIYEHVLISDDKMRVIREIYKVEMLIFTIVMFLACFLVFFKPKIRLNQVHLVILGIIVFVFFHHMLMSTFAGIKNMRYSARVSWLFVFGIGLMALFMWDNKLRQGNSKLSGLRNVESSEEGNVEL